MAAKIKVVTKEELLKVIETREPEGLFMAKDEEWYIGVDNTTEDAWTEGFATQEECAKWLREGRE